MEDLIRAGVYSLEALFFIGWAGSALVLLLTSIEDVEVLFQPEIQP